MPTLVHDISFAFRQLLKHRVYAITAILSMALGIGATAAVYSVLYGVLIDPYPYKDANRIAFINIVDKQGRGGTLSFTLTEMQQLRKAKSLEDAMIQQHVDMTETDGELPEGAYPTWEARAQYLDALIEKVKATPRVKDATLENGGLPPMGSWVQPVRIIGAPADDSRRAAVELIGADYFSVLHIPVLQGRTLTREEVLRGAHLAVVSEMFVRRYFPNVNPIGRLIVPGEMQHVVSSGLAPKNLDQPYEIVGVVGDVRNDGLHKPILPQAYVPATMLLFSGTGIFVRTVGDPRESIHAVSMSMRSLNQNQAVDQVYVFEDFLSMFAWSYDRFIFVLFTVFSAVALGLAGIGLFSVVAYTVEQRTREIGIRMALGAQRSNVLKLALASTALTAGVGLVVGIVLSVGLSDSVHRWTQGNMRDVGVLMAISAVFLVASVIACIVPARRAMRVDPMVALRSN